MRAAYRGRLHRTGAGDRPRHGVCRLACARPVEIKAPRISYPLRSRRRVSCRSGELRCADVPRPFMINAYPALGIRMNLDGLSFQVCATASIGVVSAQTRLHLTQRGSRIFGRYGGGSVLRGCLVGRVRGQALTFRYTQRECTGGIHGGHSNCVLEVLSDGRLRIHEHFTWKTREGAGTNVFEQVSNGTSCGTS